jgi:hypothetical protein
MNRTVDEQADAGPAPFEGQGSDTDLKFVAVELGEETAGGWYRELPDAQIEVLSRAQLERVPLVEADAERTAREKIAEILTRRSASSSDPS